MWGECNTVVNRHTFDLDIWYRNKARWKTALPLCPHDELGSWLYRGAKGIGCKACSLAGHSSEFAKGILTSAYQLRWSRLKKHAASEQHLRAVARVTQCDECKTASDAKVDSATAPDAAIFRQAWDARRKGTPNTSAVANMCAGKRQQVDFCMAEAIRMQQREDLRTSVCIVSHLDGKGQRLTMRYSSANEELEPCRGSFGHIRHANDADSVEAYVRTVKDLSLIHI